MKIEQNEINKICLNYENPEYSSSDLGRCKLKDEYFEVNDGALTPSCRKCISDLETLMSVIL